MHVIENIMKSLFSQFSVLMARLRGGGPVEVPSNDPPEPPEPFDSGVFMTRLKNASNTLGGYYILYILAGCAGVVLFLLMPLIISILIGVIIALIINALINYVVDKLTGRK